MYNCEWSIFFLLILNHDLETIWVLNKSMIIIIKYCKYLVLTVLIWNLPRKYYNSKLMLVPNKLFQRKILFYPTPHIIILERVTKYKVQRYKAQMPPHNEFGAKDAIQFYKQKCTQLYLYTNLKVTPNLYALYSIPCSKMISVNIITQNLLVKLCWNWPPGFYESLKTVIQFTR